MDSELKERNTLEVIYEGQAIFQSDKHWLFPLFDLADYLERNPVNMGRAEVRDKIVGRAAALLIRRLSPARVHSDLLSDLAVDVLKAAGIPYSYNRSVKRIDCETEAILQEISDPEVAYAILCKRANRC